MCEEINILIELSKTLKVYNTRLVEFLKLSSKIVKLRKTYTYLITSHFVSTPNIFHDVGGLLLSSSDFSNSILNYLSNEEEERIEYHFECINRTKDELLKQSQTNDIIEALQKGITAYKKALNEMINNI